MSRTIDIMPPTPIGGGYYRVGLRIIARNDTFTLHGLSKLELGKQIGATHIITMSRDEAIKLAKEILASYPLDAIGEV
jgi:hypothetical protein